MTNQEPIDITEEFNKINGGKKVSKLVQLRDRALDWCKEHKGMAIGIAVSAIELVRTGIKVGGKAYNRYMDIRAKDLRCYDTSLGRYWELKRKLSNKDWLIIDRRRARGERLGDILNDLNALK